MRFSNLFFKSVVAVWIFAVAAIFVSAQTSSTGTLRGKVSDPSGAVIPGASVTAKSASGQPQTVTSDAQGQYTIKGLASGQYSVSATAKGFAPASHENVAITAGRVQTLDLPLEVEVVKQQVDVEGGQAPTLDVAAANNANSITIKGKDLEALSDDPDELQSELEALAGPSAGPNGGQMYIDGFTAGQLPPKSAIREIRINQNPFSAEYDKLGYGRIEILTKPGTDKFHGQFLFSDNNSIFNSHNPFLANEPGYQTELFDGNIGGPLSKKASFFFDAQRRNIGNVAVVDPHCDAVFASLPECANQSVANPRTRTNLSPRIDYQLSANNTLTLRYQFFDDQRKNEGVGQSQNQISLPSLGYNSGDVEHTIQLSDTQVLGPRVVNETRFQFRRERDDQTPLSTQPEISVLGVFAEGGNPGGHLINIEHNSELQNYTSVSSGNHFMRFGGRLRIVGESNQSTQNFNGTFTYQSLAAFVSRTPNQFSITTGSPLISNTYVDAGLYAEDDWKLRPNLTVSYGLRYETQTAISDHADFAPRIGFAWGLGGKGSPKTVLRAGYGIFYDRFPQSLILQADRLDGTTQQQFIIESPPFSQDNVPTSFNQFSGALAPSTVYQISPHLRAPYTMQAAVGLERQLFKNATLSLTYLNSRGLHQLFTDNINAPLPGTFPAAPVCPLGCNIGNIYQYQSEGIFKQNQLIANFNLRYGARLSLFGYYTLNYANSDTAGASSFPTNPFDPSLDYGRSAFAVRNRLFIGGSVAAPYGFRLSPFIVASSGQPYNITVPENLLGTSIFNARPGLALGAPGCSVLSITDADCFFVPAPGAAYTPIPVNFGTGPAVFTVNMRVSKTFGIGPKLERAASGGRGGGGDHHHGFGGFGGGGFGHGGFGENTDHRYNLTFSASGRNIFNRQNLAPPVGVLNSNFGTFQSLAGGPFNTQSANRLIDLQVMFSF